MESPRRSLVVLLVSGLLVLAALAAFALTSTSREWRLLENTLFLAAGVCAVSVPVGTLLAFLLARTDLLGRRVLGLLTVIMLFMPLYVQTAAWLEGFGQQGWFSRDEGPLLSGWFGGIWIHSMAAIPWVTVIVAVAMRRVLPQLEEAALLDGNYRQVFWHVTLRRSLPAVLAAAVWVAVLTAGEITVTDVLSLRTYAEEVFVGFASGDTLDATLGMLPGLACFGLLVLAALGVCRIFLSVELRPPARAPVVFRLGWMHAPALLLVIAVMLCLIGVPLVNLFVNVGVVVEQTDGGFTRYWSPQAAAANLLENAWDRRSEMRWSLVTSSVAATCVLALAIPLAWWARRAGWRQWAVFVLAAILLAAPGPLIGLSLKWLFDLVDWRPWNFLVDSSILAPTTAMTIRALPLCLLIVWHALRSVPQKTLDAAALDGAGPVAQLLHIAIPQRKSALAGAWLVAMAIAMGDLSASFLVMPPSFSTLASRIFEDIHYGQADQIAGVTLALMLVMAGLATAAAWLLSRRTTL